MQAHRRQPHLQKQSLCIQENGETLWLFQAEDAILMLEVKPKTSDRDTSNTANPTIGQVVLKRLLTADQVIERLCQEDAFRNLSHHSKQSVPSLDSLHPSAQRMIKNTNSQDTDTQAPISAANQPAVDPALTQAAVPVSS